MHKIDFANLPSETPLPGMRTQCFSQNGVRMRLLEIDPSYIEPDWCQKAHFGLVLEGLLEIDFEGRVERYQPGEGFSIGENDGHKGRSLTPLTRIMLVEQD
ncbi:MAG: hypothetical protein ABI824_19505 [Acidobacteriota bacterium]